MKFAVLALLPGLGLPVLGGPSNSQWALARNQHFDVYSQAGESNAQSTLVWLERLRAFFVQAGITTGAGTDRNRIPQTGTEPRGTASGLEPRGPVRIIIFKSPEEYAAYRPHPSADAYFLSGPAREYLVLSALGSQEAARQPSDAWLTQVPNSCSLAKPSRSVLPGCSWEEIAAHEYAHLVLHSMGVQVRPWLAEGLAEFFSTVRIGERECFIGGDLPMRSLALRQGTWIPLAELLSADSPMRAGAKQTDMFYAESWALTDMLISSPKYQAHLTQLLSERSPGESDADAISRIYHLPLSGILADLHSWIRMPRSSMPLPGVSTPDENSAVSLLSDFESRTVLADLLLASDRLRQAEAAYWRLANEKPDDAIAHAALAIIALQNGNESLALPEWRRAMQLGISDASLCYRFALSAEDTAVPGAEIRDALRRCIALAPDFDDARYKLGLLESSAGNYAAAVEQLRAMRSLPAKRAYAYWTAMSSALTETDERDAAKDAAANAMRYATTAEQRVSASSLAYAAATDLTVQLARDAQGNLQVVTTRKPHGSDDWNPFIEPGDNIRRVEGQIRKVECTSGRISGFRVANASTAVEVALPDPAHVLIRGGTPEFVCGAEDGRKVAIEYAASNRQTPANGILRGMQFR